MPRSDEELSEHTCQFWDEKVDIKDDATTVRVCGQHYIIGDEQAGSFMRGHGGAKWRIKFLDGRELTTTNLWMQGDIPLQYQDILPDNAIFLPGGSTNV